MIQDYACPADGTFNLVHHALRTGRDSLIHIHIIMYIEHNPKGGGVYIPTLTITLHTLSFQVTGHEPDVYRHLPRDVLLYKILMGISVFGIGTALTCVYKMATGSMPAKRD